MLKQLRVSHGIFFVLTILTLVQVISGCWNIYSYSRNASYMEKVANNYTRIKTLNEAFSDISNIRSQMWKISFLMSAGVISGKDSAQIDNIKQNYILIDEKMKRFLDLSARGTDKERRDAESVYRFYKETRQLQMNNLGMLERHEFNALATFSSNTNPTKDFLDKIQLTSESINKDVIEPAIQTSKESVDYAIIYSVVFVALCILFTVFAMFWSRKYLINKMKQLMLYQAAIAKGDLSVAVQVDGSNEVDTLAKGLSDMQDSLSETIRSVRSGANNIYTSIQEIAAGNNDLSGRTEEQASVLEQTAASMEQLTATVKNNTENTRQVAALAAETEALARRGGELTQNMVQTMGLITQSSHKISEIIAVIDGIAFQTNILALNAAVEAARAGVHGQGFAVVASEVRSLALRSAEAAKEIKALINTSVSHVQSGNTLTAEVDQAIGKMMEGAGNAKMTLEEIFRSSEEQSRGIEQISQAMREMDTVTQQNASLVEQSAAATASLEDQIKRLNQIVGFFNVDNREYSLTEPAGLPLKPSLE